jgi:cyclophilin family peptidyl-prolyl cis-trans isomerase
MSVATRGQINRILSIVAGVILCASEARAQIFADFTTSKGTFSCQLDFTNAPRCVANFVGLATGQRAWLDLNTGRARNDPFYDGVTFHRVITNFMVQAGSPNGLGTDGPGYAFPDEFNPALVFTNFGVLAMANSGTNSNGAQFFVTVAPFTSGNNTYSIFGRLVAGSNTVYTINHVATDSNDKPLTNVVIQQVAIRRVGPAAEAFDINAYNLPLVSNPPLQIAKGTGQMILTLTNRIFSDNRWFVGTNLSSLAPWKVTALGVEITNTPATTNVTNPSAFAQKFYRHAQVVYPSSTFAPKNVYGKKLTMVFTQGGPATNVITFDSAGGGTYDFPPYPAGTLTGYVWTQDIYRGSFQPITYSGLVPMNFTLNFTNTLRGFFKGTANNTFPPSDIAGRFALQ